MSERLSRGELVAGIAGLVLILVMFLFAWYGYEGFQGGDAFDAYDDWVNIILVFTSFAAMSLALFGSAVARAEVPLSVITTVLGAVSAVIIFIYIPQPARCRWRRWRHRHRGGPRRQVRRLARARLGDRDRDRRLHGDAGGGHLLRRHRRPPRRRPLWRYPAAASARDASAATSPSAVGWDPTAPATASSSASRRRRLSATER